MANNLFSALAQEQIEVLQGSGVQLSGEGAAANIVVPSEAVTDVMLKLRDGEGFQFDYLADVTAVDRGDAGFEVVYQLFSLQNQAKGSVKVIIPRTSPQIPSVTSIWPGADWMEREVYDLMGVEFTGHPCLNRILLPDEFVGHPLRKDFKMQQSDDEVK